MDDIIQCPTCSKKYRLKGNPPPTFTCRECGTVMDLSAFAQPAAPAPAAPAAPAQPAAPPPPAGGAPSRGTVPSRRRGAGGHRRPRGAAARGRHRRDEYPDEDYDDERPRYQPRKQGPSSALIIGSVAAFLVAVIIVIVMVMSQEEPPPPKEEPEVAKEPYVEPPDEPEPPKEEPKVLKPKPGREDEKRPELAQGNLDSLPVPEGKQKYRWQRAEIKTYPYPDHVTAEEKNKIEEMMKELEWGGRGMYDAMDALAEMDCRDADGKLKPGTEFKAVGRLISEFKNILDAYDNSYENEECKARLMTVDKILRKIDGFQQRDFADRQGIRVQSTESEVKHAILRWNWWYDLHKWQLRREPWDEREDLEDPEAMGDEGFGDEDDLEPLDGEK